MNWQLCYAAHWLKGRCAGAVTTGVTLPRLRLLPASDKPIWLSGCVIRVCHHVWLLAMPASLSRSVVQRMLQAIAQQQLAHQVSSVGQKIARKRATQAGVSLFAYAGLAWRCAALCCAVLCCAVLCCAVLCCAVLCCAVLCCAVLCCAVLCCAVLCCAVLRCAVLCKLMCGCNVCRCSLLAELSGRVWR